VTRYLSPEQVLYIHYRLIEQVGGTGGILDLGMLLSAVSRPQAGFEGRDLYPDLFAKAAALLDSLIRNHPFVDGNKRTAITAAALFLRLNGFQLEVEPSEMVRFTLECAQSRLSLEEIAAWLQRYSQEST
jgi:death-on-curing protein